MAAIGKVSAVFTASTSGLTSGVKAASSAFRGLQSDTARLASGMRALVAIQGAQLFGSIASSAAAGIRSLVAFGQAQADVIDNTSKMAARLGMTYGEFAGLSLAADLAGVSMESIGAASQKAEIAFAKAAAGSATATAAFAGLGLSVEQLNGLSAADRFDAIASAIAALPTEAQRAAAAVQVFGRAGAELLPLFQGGAEGIAAARAEAERLGLALTSAQGQDVEAMNDSFTMVQKAISGVVQQVVAYLAPAVTAVANTFTQFVGSVGGANIGQAIGEGILSGARVLAEIGDYLIVNLSGVWEYVSQVGGQWGEVFSFGERIANLFVGAFNVFETVGNVIGGLFSDIISGLYAAAANIASVVPGMGEFAAQLEASAASWNAQGREFAAAMNQNQAEAAAAFAAAFGEGQAQAGQAIAGPLTTALNDATAQAQQSAASISQASRTPVTVTQEVVVNATEAIKGIDSRSTEGIAEMFRIMRGGANDIAARQLAALEQIADNTAGGEDVGVLEF